MNTYNLTNIEPQFKDWLLAGNISSITVRNYLSDYRHFRGWYIGTHTNDCIYDLTTGILLKYMTYLNNSGLPIKTINRRLSTMRKFCTCLRELALLSGFPERILSNVSSIKLDADVYDEVKAKIISEFKYELLMNSDDSNDSGLTFNYVEDLLNHTPIK